jgi:hypothetical protein
VTRELFIRPNKTSNIKTTLDWFQNPGDLSVLHLSQANLASFLWEFIIRALANLSQSLTELATTKSFFSLLGKFTFAASARKSRSDNLVVLVRHRLP